MMYYLYKIINTVNNKVYIGQTVRPKERWSQHKAYVKNGKLFQYVHRAMNKHGIENFVFEVIATCTSQDYADETEKILIVQYDSRNPEKGYNIAPGGDPAWNRGLPKEQQPMYGKKQSDNFKKRMFEVHKGKTVVITDETKQKMSNVRKGKTKSEEWKKKISDSNKGVARSEETKKRISESKKGNSNKLGKFKLSEQQEDEIVKLHHLGLSNNKIARAFNCSHTLIGNILKRKLA